MPDKMIVTNWLLYSSLFIAYGHVMGQYDTFEERIGRLMGMSILFLTVLGIFMLSTNVPLARI